MPDGPPRRRRARPVADAPVDALLLRAEDLTKGWLLALLEQAPLDDAPAILAADLARDGPRVCAAVVHALSSDADLQRLEPGGALEAVVSQTGSFAGAQGVESTSRAVDALGAVIWSAVRDELVRPDPDQVSELAERLARVIELVRGAALRRGPEARVSSAAPGPGVASVAASGSVSPGAAAPGAGSVGGLGVLSPGAGSVGGLGAVSPGAGSVGGLGAVLPGAGSVDDLAPVSPGVAAVSDSGSATPGLESDADPATASPEAPSRPPWVAAVRDPPSRPDPSPVTISWPPPASPGSATREPPAGPSSPDPLWMGALDDEVQRAQRTGTPLSLLLVELEDADRVLAADGARDAAATFGRFAQAVRGVARRQDILACESDARAWVIARDTPRPGARALGARIVSAVRGAPAWRGAPLTVNLGLAVFGEDGRDGGGLIHAAEEAMFAAAASGSEIADGTGEGAGPGDGTGGAPEDSGPELVS